MTPKIILKLQVMVTKLWTMFDSIWPQKFILFYEIAKIKVMTAFNEICSV